MQKNQLDSAYNMSLATSFTDDDDDEVNDGVIRSQSMDFENVCDARTVDWKPQQQATTTDESGQHVYVSFSFLFLFALVFLSLSILKVEN